MEIRSRISLQYPQTISAARLRLAHLGPENPGHRRMNACQPALDILPIRLASQLATGLPQRRLLLHDLCYLLPTLQPHALFQQFIFLARPRAQHVNLPHQFHDALVGLFGSATELQSHVPNPSSHVADNGLEDTKTLAHSSFLHCSRERRIQTATPPSQGVLPIFNRLLGSGRHQGAFM